MIRKTIYLLLLVPLLGVAELDIEKVNRVLLGLKSSKQLHFFNDNQQLVQQLENKKSKLKFTSLKNADILLFPKSPKSEKVVIVNSYKALKKNSESIGAIYLLKGRTQIVFVDERLEKKGLHLSKDLHEYLIDECLLNPICLL
ncbi:MAG: hypothetical protein K0U38_03640 [Epsilonproteobacteria bacterium]|nr:hypothetical protein [Campylobacterota bacterium]